MKKMSDNEGNSAAPRKSKEKVVVPKEELSRAVHTILKRDYFPSTKTMSEPGFLNESAKLPRLDVYLKGKIDEDQAAFSKILNHDAGLQAAKFGNKSNFLRLKDSSSHERIENQRIDAASRDKEIIPENTRFLKPTLRRRPLLTPASRKRDDLDMVSMTTRSTVRSYGSNGKPMTDRALTLVKRLRKDHR